MPEVWSDLNRQTSHEILHDGSHYFSPCAIVKVAVLREHTPGGVKVPYIYAFAGTQTTPATLQSRLVLLVNNIRCD